MCLFSSHSLLIQCGAENIRRAESLNGNPLFSKVPRCYNHFSRTQCGVVLGEAPARYWFSHILVHLEFQLITKLRANSFSAPPLSFRLPQPLYFATAAQFQICFSVKRGSGWGKRVPFLKSPFGLCLSRQSPGRTIFYSSGTQLKRNHNQSRFPGMRGRRARGSKQTCR